MRTYLLIIDGAGEYESDYHALRIEARDPREALEAAIKSTVGYGKNSDGKAFVVDMEHVHAFTINDSTRKVAEAAPDPAKMLELADWSPT